MSNGIKACPFCGGLSQVYSGGLISCHCISPEGMVNYETWNTRPLEDAQYKAGMLAAAEIVEKVEPVPKGLHDEGEIMCEALDQAKLAILNAAKEEL